MSDFTPEDLGVHHGIHQAALAAEAADVIARGGRWLTPYLSLPTHRPHEEDTPDGP